MTVQQTAAVTKITRDSPTHDHNVRSCCYQHQTVGTYLSAAASMSFCHFFSAFSVCISRHLVTSFQQFSSLFWQAHLFNPFHLLSRVCCNQGFLPSSIFEPVDPFTYLLLFIFSMHVYIRLGHSLALAPLYVSDTLGLHICLPSNASKSSLISTLHSRDKLRSCQQYANSFQPSTPSTTRFETS